MNANVSEKLPKPDAQPATPLVAVVGNPNTGKTTLFNRLTGQRAKVGNYPGVTVDRRSGTMKLHVAEQRAPNTGGPPATALELVDVPGCYSLSARSGEEEIAIQALLGLGGNPRPDIALVVVDATQLVRNLYLVVQVLELGIPTVIALNMIDEAGDEPPDARALEAVLGVPCVAISARYGMGVPQLRTRLAEAIAEPPRGAPTVEYPPAVREDLDTVVAALPRPWRADPSRDQALALWALLSIDRDDELLDMPDDLRVAVETVQRRAEQAGRDLDHEVIGARYRWLDAHHDAFYRPPPPRNTTERVDRVLLHPVFGFVVFIAIMGTMFQALFSWSEPAIALVEAGFGRLADASRAVLPAGVLTDLLTDGVIAGVGSVVVFLPQILLLFFFIGLLEDSGYMSRAAYLMDRVMRALGLNGRAFVPMLSGFACAVPAILATRNMERQRDRFLTMMVVPLMTCSARLPVYTLIIATLFPAGHVLGFIPVQSGLMVAMYLFSTVVALVAAGVLGRTVLKGPRVPLILELPPYRLPTLSAVVRMVWERAKSFLHEAGTMILACTVVLWALLSFPALPGDGPGDHAAPDEVSAWQAASLEHSYGGRIGKAIEPVIAPLGFDWKIGVGVIGAFAAREVFVSTMGLVYGIGDEGVDENDRSLRERIRAEKGPDGTPRYTPLMGLSLMVFFALACQCVSTLAVVRRETRSWRWPLFLFGYMTALAWGAAFAIYQGGLLLGLG